MPSHIEFGWFKSIFIIIPKSNVTHAFLIYSLYIYIYTVESGYNEGFGRLTKIRYKFVIGGKL